MFKYEIAVEINPFKKIKNWKQPLEIKNIDFEFGKVLIKYVYRSVGNRSFGNTTAGCLVTLKGHLVTFFRSFGNYFFRLFFTRKSFKLTHVCLLSLYGVLHKKIFQFFPFNSFYEWIQPDFTRNRKTCFCPISTKTNIHLEQWSHEVSNLLEWR